MASISTSDAEAVLFIGLQASGKTSFYRERFCNSHVRISLDLLKTRHRERSSLATCLATRQNFVIDNTNVSRAERTKYVDAARAARFKIVGYYFQSRVEDSLRRNSGRAELERVPDVAILAMAKKLERPNFDEGFDELFYVRMQPDAFIVESWKDEI